MEKVAYLVVGDNNFWYTTTEPLTEQEFKETIETLKEEINNSEYCDEPFKPNQIFAYPLHVKMDKISFDITNGTIPN